MDPVKLITTQVKTRVRQALDEPPARLIDAAIDEYQQESLTGRVAPLADVGATRKAVADQIEGYGDLQPYFDDPTVEEIWINAPARVFVARSGASELTTTILTSSQVAAFVEQMLARAGRRLDRSTPFVDARLPDGSRLHVVIPDITAEHPAINIRKFLPGLGELTELTRRGTLTTLQAAYLDAAVVAGLNIVVSGGTQAGKTTLLAALAGVIPPRARIITCEEVFELPLVASDIVPMQTRSAGLEGTGEVTLRRLVVEALRMRPDRLIIGEVRGAECLDLLIGLNSGTPGLATIHANSAHEAVTKLRTLPLLAGENVTDSFVVPTVAAAIDLVVHLRRLPAGQRRIDQILAIPGRVEAGQIVTAPVFDGAGRPDVGWSVHAERFAEAGIDVNRIDVNRIGDE